MRSPFVLLLTLVVLSSFAQDNSKIDSLLYELQVLSKRIEEVNFEIRTEILDNGYYVLVKKVDSSKLELRNRKYGVVVGEILDGDIIKVVGKEIGFFKVEYRGVKGFIKESAIIIDKSSPLKLLGYKYSKKRVKPKKRTGSKSYSKSSKKSLNQSKPVKVKGHYRTSKSGKKYYVRPHTRNRPGGG